MKKGIYFQVEHSTVKIKSNIPPPLPEFGTRSLKPEQSKPKADKSKPEPEKSKSEPRLADSSSDTCVLLDESESETAPSPGPSGTKERTTAPENPEDPDTEDGVTEVEEVQTNSDDEETETGEQDEPSRTDGGVNAGETENAESGKLNKGWQINVYLGLGQINLD